LLRAKYYRNELNGSKEYEGSLSFATNARTSPNHKAFVAVSVHFVPKGQLMCIILDVVKVAEVRHSQI
jgi:hypothetical protein